MQYGAPNIQACEVPVPPPAYPLDEAPPQKKLVACGDGVPQTSISAVASSTDRADVSRAL
jgi:hypothetical protein